MRKAFTLLTAVVLLAASAMAQTPAGGGRYGLSAWAINNQRVASQFNYDIDSLFGSGLGTFQFPSGVCSNALALGGNKNVNPFNTNATVKIVDLTSANTETVALNSITNAGGICTLSLANANAHSSYHLRSGTCGLLEALNDLGGGVASGGGEVIVDQKFYDDGCTTSTITAVTAAKAMANIFVHDISGGQDTWYALKPSATTNISAAAAPTMGTVAGGTFTNGNVIGCVTYVDALGGESPCTTNETTQATGGTTNGLTVTAPLASTGAVGYRVYLTAVGGSSGTEVDHTTAANCGGSLTTLETVLPACPMSANFSALAPITGTSKVPPVATAHSTITYQPVQGVVSASNAATVGNTQLFAFNNAAGATVSNSNEDLAEIITPAGYFNSIGKSWQVCAKIATGTQVASAVIAVKLNMASKRQQSAVTLSTITFATQTMAAAGTIQGCWIVTTAATGASGTFWSSSSLWTNTLNSTPSQTVSGSVDVTTAVSSAVDLTKQLFVSLNFGETATHNVTAPQVLQFVITPVPGT